MSHSMACSAALAYLLAFAAVSSSYLGLLLNSKTAHCISVRQLFHLHTLLETGTST